MVTPYIGQGLVSEPRESKQQDSTGGPVFFFLFLRPLLSPSLCAGQLALMALHGTGTAGFLT